jgi:hypothetical protein
VSRQVTGPSESMDFAADYLRVGYVFWRAQEPYYSQKVIPLREAFTDR